jgi:hypothetical protein
MLLKSWRATRQSFRDAMEAHDAGQKTPPAQYLVRTFQGRAEHPGLTRMLSDGWEILDSSPVVIGGTSLPRQRVWTLRKVNPDYPVPTR